MLKHKSGTQLQQALKGLKEKNDKEYYVLLRLPDFYEDIGLLVSSGCLKLQLAKDLFDTAIKYHYNYYEAAIGDMREIYRDQTIYKFFSDLATATSE